MGLSSNASAHNQKIISPMNSNYEFKTPVKVLRDLALDSRHVIIKNETFIKLFPDLVAKIMQDLEENREKGSLTDNEKLIFETMNTKNYNDMLKNYNGKNHVDEKLFFTKF